MKTIARTAAALAAAALVSVAAPAASADDLVAPGVGYRTFTVSTAHGPVTAYLVTVDLRTARLDLLHPADVAEREGVAEMATAQHAVAGTNGDFFNISETHAGVPATGSSVGPEIAGGQDLKFAVPDGQRFGPAMPPGATTKIVFGLGEDQRARVSSVDLHGAVVSSKGTFELEGLNQYAIPVGGIGEYTHDWGEVSRARAACGTDTNRSAGCTTQVEEVVVRHGVVTSESETLGAGPIPEGTVVLVGREQGADELERLAPGDHVVVGGRLSARNVPPFEFAVGGFPILSGGQPVPGLDAATLAPRTAAGASADGRTAYLLTVDGRSAASSGMSVAELADLLHSAGAAVGVNLDGGGSTTMAVGGHGQAATVRNIPSDGTERAVANGIGVFSAR
ncbi:phosphodiester glycosidase family protein [Amycolatopsis alkalitolerans]|uniref:Phosphodiester glycosidase family protein n=1 Tax=Amycolatopsis alkalitolerans TaxID=2547244 RepID=A0A5C4LTT0_9PSEU|nr:phosphodiester glycosidase family protein [Amycolatopsis alkalitolerans]TNC22215.1 phosphodiester glycosidase family protein [Amycolatopsis alkalitolerans]